MTWQTKKLGDVCKIVNGGTPKTNIKNYWDGDILWITPKDMGRLKSVHVSDTERKISKEGLKDSSAKIIPLNSIILSSRAPIGYLAINKKEITTNQGCKGIIPKKETDVQFLFYFLTHSADLLQKLGSGTTFKELSSTKLSGIEIQFPPLPEQHRIVKILDEVFEKAAKAKENAEKNLQNSKELFESYLQSFFMNPRKDWKEKTLNELFIIKPPKKEAQEKLKKDDLISFVQMENLGIGKKDLNLEKERKLYDVSGSYTYFSNEDVLLAKITPCFENGKLGIARNLKNGIGFGSSEFIVFRSKGEILPDYLYYFLFRDQFRKVGRERMSGAVGHKRVSKEFIEENILPFPKSLSEQKSIVTKLDTLSTETKKLEAIYKKKIADLEELKKSVLKKAFAGEL